MSPRHLLSTAIFIVLGFESHARADTCTYSVVDPGFTGDAHYSQQGSCLEPYGSYFWSAFDFDKENWDDGFGYDSPCDVTRPLGRTFNALYALQYSSDMPDYSSNDGYQGTILEWAGVYAAKKIDELDARCNGGPGVNARTWFWPSPDQKTELYLNFFYQLSAPERAATIIHEARHASEKGHNSSDCWLGGGCDTSWAYNGAYRYHVTWAMHFVDRGINAPAPLKKRLVDRTNDILDTSFENHPGFHLMHADVPLLADINGDKRDELVAWQPSTGLWYAMNGMTKQWMVHAVQWGDLGDVPIVGDFNGDGRDDFAVWRPSTGHWHAIHADGSLLFENQQWGMYSDVPLVGDFNGDNADDLVVWRPETGMWNAITPWGALIFQNVQWGMKGDVPRIGDFDGDGKDDLAVWRPSTGEWHAITSGGAQLFVHQQWGMSGDVPLVGDFDSDGRDDLAVWRPSTGEWHAIKASGELLFGNFQWGDPGDIPLVGKIDANKSHDLLVWRPTLGTWAAFGTNTNQTMLFGGLPFGTPY